MFHKSLTNNFLFPKKMYSFKSIIDFLKEDIKKKWRAANNKQMVA